MDVEQATRAAVSFLGEGQPFTLHADALGGLHIARVSRLSIDEAEQADRMRVRSAIANENSGLSHWERRGVIEQRAVHALGLDACGFVEYLERITKGE